MESMTQNQAFEYALQYANTDQNTINVLLNELNKSGERLEDFLLDCGGEQWQTGGGCTVTAYELENGELALASDEAFTIYENSDSFWNDEGENALFAVWLSDYRSFRFSN